MNPRKKPKHSIKQSVTKEEVDAYYRKILTCPYCKVIRKFQKVLWCPECDFEDVVNEDVVNEDVVK